MTASGTYISFLVRLWREEAGDGSKPDGAWESQVEHIQTGRRWSFNTLAELLDFFSRQAASANPPNAPDTSDRLDDGL